MALRKEEIDEVYDKEKRVMKERTRITIDVSPELRQRIKIAAASQESFNQRISEQYS